MPSMRIQSLGGMNQLLSGSAAGEESTSLSWLLLGNLLASVWPSENNRWTSRCLLEDLFAQYAHINQSRSKDLL